MPIVKTPDGVEIHWIERGEGPLIVFASQFFGYPEVFEDLISDLVTDHRVVTYDTRGTGRSTKRGPYDIRTDVEDLGALIEEIGGPAVVMGIGDGSNRGVKLGAARPDLVVATLTPGGNPIGRLAAEGSDALVDSPSVLQALVGMMETDYRAALRTMISSANPQMDEEKARERVDGVVAYCPQEVGIARLRAWIDDEVLAEARAVGSGLWIVSFGNNEWFPAATLDRTRELLPEAHIEEVEDGPISRPDLTAAIARRITSDQAAVRAAASETSS
jgi:pimeloyl-ACP methyl ester carboxylesterase